MKIKELHEIQNEYLQKVNDFFLKVEKELKEKITFKVSIEEIKVEPDEIWADYKINVGTTEFMLDCSPTQENFRLAVFEGTKLADKIIKKYKAEYDDIFENYIIAYTKDLNDIIKVFKGLEKIK